MSVEAPRCLITLCTYNERDNVDRLIPEIRAAVPSADLLVVDDNSPDGTSEVVRQLSATDPQIQLLWRAKKAGLGAATLAGFQVAIDRGYDFVLNMDADFSHAPRYLPELLAAMTDADIVIGSRYVPGGRIMGWPPLRHVMSRGINAYSRWLLGLTCHDCSGAYRCYRISKLRELDFSKFRARGYAFQEEMLYRCARIGCRIKEIPIVFEDRIAGQSKINPRETIRALQDILLLTGDRVRGVSVKTAEPIADR